LIGVNNVLVFSGILRGALDCVAERITEEMKIAAAKALAAGVFGPSADQVLSEPLDLTVTPRVAAAVKCAST